MKLNKWSTVSENATPYMAPELIRLSLHGKVDNHPKLGKNKEVTTSTIEKVDGRKITTRSGNLYILGKIDPNFRKFLKRTRPNWNWRKPITIKGE